MHPQTVPAWRANGFCSGGLANTRTCDVLDCARSQISRDYHEQNKAKRIRRGMFVRGRDAHWQPGRYFAASLARVERVRRNRLRGYAPDAEAAFAFRYSEANGELPRTQRNYARGGNRDRAGAGRANRAGHRRRDTGNFRPWRQAGEFVPAARSSSCADSWGVRVCGGAGGFGHAD